MIDGQQRLTTLFLLLNCLGETTKTHLTFECRDRSNYTLENIQKVVKGKNDLDEKQQEDNIVKGVEIIKRTLEKEEKNKSGFKEGLKTKLQDVILFQIIVPKHNIQGLDTQRFNIEICPVRKVEEAFRFLFG